MATILALNSIPISNTIGSIAAPATTGRTLAANQASATPLPIGSQPSVNVQFSAFVGNLLAQQARDPSLNLDTVLARNLAGLAPGSTTGGQLYTSEGLLQQYATSLLLSQINIAGSDDVTANAFTGIADAAHQIAQDASLSPLTNQAVQLNRTAANTEPLSNTLDTTDAQARLADIEQLALETTLDIDAAEDEPLNDAPDTPENPAAATPQATTTTVTAPPVGVSAQLTSSNLDAYQQAALMSGLTSFGKELNTFVPATTDPTLDSPIGPVAPITAIKARSDLPEEAQASLPS